MESTGDNDTKRVKIRRSSGETQYVTPSELKRINERRRDRHKQLNSLRKQRNFAAGVAVVAIIFSTLLLFSGPVIVEVPIKSERATSEAQAVSSQIVPPQTSVSIDAEVANSLAVTKTPVEEAAAIKRAEPKRVEPKRTEQQSIEPVRIPSNVAVAGAPALSEEHAEEDAIEEISIAQAPPQVIVSTPNEQLLAWAQAWSAQDVELYLGFYGNDYKPSGGISKDQWMQQRYTRLSKPKWISIDVSDVEVSFVDDSLVELRFSQGFSSDRFSDVSSKLVVMGLEEGNWRILEERSL